MTTTRGGKTVYFAGLQGFNECVNCGHKWKPRKGSDMCPRCKLPWAVKTRGRGWRKGVSGAHEGAGWPKGVRRGIVA